MNYLHADTCIKSAAIARKIKCKNIRQGVIMKLKANKLKFNFDFLHDLGKIAGPNMLYFLGKIYKCLRMVIGYFPISLITLRDKGRSD